LSRQKLCDLEDKYPTLQAELKTGFWRQHFKSKDLRTHVFLSHYQKEVRYQEHLPGHFGHVMLGGQE
jgi:hypothetical protein